MKLQKPITSDVNRELQWLGTSLGLFSLRDKDRSCFRVFIELLKSAKQGIPLSSDELAERLSLTRGTVIHHINNLMSAGIVIHEYNKYTLRVDKLQDLIEELRRDLMRTLDNLEEVATELDKALNL